MSAGGQITSPVTWPDTAGRLAGAGRRAIFNPSFQDASSCLLPPHGPSCGGGTQRIHPRPARGSPWVWHTLRALTTPSPAPRERGGPGRTAQTNNLPASCAAAAVGWAGNLGASLPPMPPSGCGCLAAPDALAFLARDSFFRMRPPGVASFRRKGLRPVGSPLLLTFGFSWATLWATADARSP